MSGFLHGRGLGPNGGVACSGGPDSVALLLALYELNVPVTVAHVNHQLRGAESDADETFVSEVASKLKLPFRSTRIKLPEANLEATARRERYAWFATLGLDWIATGHTADDQAETILHRLIRGTGLRGLRGIQEALEFQSPPIATGGLSVIRPLLKVTRLEVLSFLENQHQSYRTDSTNIDPRFTRNRIRREVLPLLKEFNPEIVDVLNRLGEQATETFAHLAENAAVFLQAAEKPRAGSALIFDCEVLSKGSPLIVREALRLAWQREGWPLDRMTFDDWQRLAALAPGDYPGRIRLALTPLVAQLGPRS